MANRCPGSPAAPPAPAAPPPSSASSSSSVASPAETPTAPRSWSGAGTPDGAARGRSGLARPNQSTASSRAEPSGGGVVCGLIGKFECTQPSDGADVKVTVNGGRRLIASGTSPGIGGDVPRGCADKTPAAMGGSARSSVAGSSGGGAGVGADRAGGVVTVSNEGKELANVAGFAGQRQRKTVVYSRLCLDGAMLEALCPSEEAEEADRGHPGPPEVIRFPCVERLIALYASIIREKEAEMQRFMSSIVRDGDKRRLDKGVSSSPSPSPLSSSARSEKQVGDIRTATARQPAPVTLGTPPYTVRPLESHREVDGQLAARSVTLPPGEELGARSKESPSPASDEGWRSTQPSPYGSSDEEERPRPGETSDTGGGCDEEEHPESMKHRDKVTRSASSDSALGLDEELSQQEQQQMMATVGKVRRLTLGVSDIPLRAALLPVPEPSLLPTTTDSLVTQTGGTTADHSSCPTVVRSKMILEAQLIELPVLPVDSGSTDQQQQQQQQLGCPPSTSASRRESAQSYISDTGEGVRYVRTPSVVVSDYSDDTICGITLEEIEYFRRHRLRRRSADCESDLSAASSCSNLNYCGSSISALEGCEYQSGLRTPERKVSDCSTCSTVSCDEDEGYSVVRAKLANLCPPTTTTTTTSQGTKVPSVAAPEAAPTDREPDVRICSKQSKVSPAPESCSVQRPA
ncbi:uncharacterized protein LOC131207493 [Anopheles bellator]|uniref:uncharacterized protein LOC131207493 n=1 Tax=Anopheles bellator TaxID=139047 RepID=UPI002649A32C|nr:uncharacterized protein LOC131207493 [Anopheles bellator]